MLARTCVDIPKHDEAAMIAMTVRTARERFGRIVRVDDDSSNGSPVLARAADADVVRHPGSVDLGAVLETGVRPALHAASV